jgi:hypothetical protein
MQLLTISTATDIGGVGVKHVLRPKSEENMSMATVQLLPQFRLSRSLRLFEGDVIGEECVIGDIPHEIRKKEVWV